jgi:hypothetical protein
MKLEELHNRLGELINNGYGDYEVMKSVYLKETGHYSTDYEFEVVDSADEKYLFI